MEKKEFKYTFQITKQIVFQISYYTLGKNKSPYFSTSACVFNRPKSDYTQGGQCQEDVLTGVSLEFFNKYDCLHSLDLTFEQYNSIVNDIEELKEKYNWIDNQNFYGIRDLSKMNLKKAK